MENEYLQRPLTLTETQIETLLVDLGASYTKRQGENVQSSHCMLHHNSSPTLGVSVLMPHAYNCFSCHAKGPDVVSLVEKVKRITRQEAFSYIVEKFSIDIGSNKFSLKHRYIEEAPHHRFVLSKNALAAYPLDADDNLGYRAAEHYLGINKATADKFKLGYRIKDHRLVFPVWHADGQLAGLIGRCLLLSCTKQNRWRNFDTGSFKREFVMMGSELKVDTSKPMLVVEGPRDFFKLRSLGYDNVRATLGSSTSEWQIEQLAATGCDIVPLYDEDRAGEDGRRRLRKALKGQAHVLSFKFPASAIDAETGKGDPAMLTVDTLAELITTFRRGFNFARMSTSDRTPH